ncbi:MAG: recombinase family protein [Acidimicrobiales bacterium]
MRHVAVYSRISVDRSGRAEGVDLQQRKGLDYASSAWPGLPVEVYCDNDISAASGAHRPGYDALRAAVRAGQVAHLWVIEQTRLERREAAWFELAAELDAAGIIEVHTDRDGIVRVGSEVAGIKAVLAAAEARRLRSRVKDKMDDLASAGRPNGGSRYGYRRALDADGRKTLVIDEAEAAVIREAAELVLAGWSMTRIADHLAAKGVTGPRSGGKLWPGSVKSILTSPTAAGLRSHHGRILGAGTWEPILDEGTWQAVKAKLGAPRTLLRADGSTYEVSGRQWKPRTARRHLLTGGIARCGVCEAPLVGQHRARRDGPVPYLMCHPNRGGKACAAVLMAPVDALVVSMLWEQLDRPEFLAEVAGDHDAERRHVITSQLSAQERKRAELAALWTDGDLTSNEWQTARRAIAEREQELWAELAAIPTHPIDIARARSARGAWDVMTLDERREMLRLFIDAVVVHRATSKMPKFDPSRIEIRWK